MPTLHRIGKDVYYTEMRQSLNPDSFYLFKRTDLKTQNNPKNDDADCFLGNYNDTAYYFNYQIDQITTLGHAFLATMKTKAAID